MSSTLSPTDFDSLEIQGQYSDINNRWDLPDSDWDNDSSSARLFERSRIKALAGESWVTGWAMGWGTMLRMLGEKRSEGTLCLHRVRGRHSLTSPIPGSHLLS